MTSTIIFTMTSVRAAVGRTLMYFSRRLKKHSRRQNRSMRASWLARTSLAAWAVYCHERPDDGSKKDAYLVEDTDPSKNRTRRWKCLRQTSESLLDCLNCRAYQPNYVSYDRRECVQDVDSWIEPIGQPFVHTLRFVDGLDLGSKDGEDSTGGFAGLDLGG
jgi:hypothetical protein